jgi:hypothetical protein
MVFLFHQLLTLNPNFSPNVVHKSGSGKKVCVGYGFRDCRVGKFSFPVSSYSVCIQRTI